MQNPWKSLFPALANSQTAYFDSASSCQMPAIVIDAISDYLTTGHGNPHRGMYAFSEKAESLQQQCRERVARFIHCQSEQIAFTKSTTESINLVTNSFYQNHFKDGLNPSQSILVTQMEHHANLLPWQRLCAQTGTRLNILPITEQGELDLTDLEKYLADNCALFAFSHCSNVLGHLNPVEQLVSTAKKFKVPTLIDGAQAIAHYPVDVAKIDCDYYVFSGHKLYGPGGIGVLYCKQPESVTPLLLGGGIVNRVRDTSYELVDEIDKLEAGSANMLGIVGLNAALNFIAEIGLDNIQQHENALTQQVILSLDKNHFKIISHPDSHHLVSIVSPHFHSHDIASILADNNVAVRAGHHCAQPCLTAMGHKHCVRISLGVYNDEGDLERLMGALGRVPGVLG